jgi:hypothetical protein
MHQSHLEKLLEEGSAEVGPGWYARWTTVGQQAVIPSSYQGWKGNFWIWKKSLLGMYFLCWSDYCVQVSSNLVSRSSRIKVGKKDLNFEKFSRWIRQVRYRPDKSVRLFQYQPLMIVLSVIY